MLHLGCSDTVRQRTQRTVGRCVGVPTYDGHARESNALLRTHHVDNTLTHIVDLKFKDLKIATVVIQCLYLQSGNWIGNTRDTATALMGFRRHVVVGNRKIRIHTPGLAIVQPQTFKRLRRGHFVNQLAIIGEIGTAGGTHHAIEFGGEVVRALSMEGRMTICNMAIEAGARVGLIGVDETTVEYVKGRPYAPTGQTWEQAVAAWSELHTDSDAHFDRVVELRGEDIEPQVTWGTSPEMVLPVNGTIPDPASMDNVGKQAATERALHYMGLKAGMKITDIKLDTVFIGSCTNSRIEDLRAAATVVKGKKVSATVKRALVVPGSGKIKQQAEEEGLDKIFTEAGMEWREPGCSMCLAMNSDKLGEGEHCASTSNRNFEGRQGFGGRTHLVSPAMAAAAAVAGHFVDIRNW